MTIGNKTITAMDLYMTCCVNSKKDNKWWREGGIKQNRAKRRRISHPANNSEPQTNGTDTVSTSMDDTETESTPTDDTSDTELLS